MKSLTITWVNSQQRKFDVEKYTISDGVIRLYPINKSGAMKVVPTHNVMILEEDEA